MDIEGAEYEVLERISSRITARYAAALADRLGISEERLEMVDDERMRLQPGETWEAR